MMHDFSNISPEELARLFPIRLEEHNSSWKTFYLQERDYLQTVFGGSLVRISHIGSSAVAGLIAKPTVDILLEVSDDIHINAITEALLDVGYVVNTPDGDIIMYIKGYTPRGFEGQAVHIHVRYSGDWDELYFRDYLLSHPDVAQEYGKLKRMLQGQYEHDRDGYTESKGCFIQRYTALARAEFPNKYKPESRIINSKKEMPKPTV